MVAIAKYGRDEIFDAVKQMYTAVARQPERNFHFPTGRTACEFLGYPAEQLDAISASAVESFAGVGYPFRCNLIKKGDSVLDIGAGAGTDVLISALITSEAGKVYGLELTEAMQQKLTANAVKAGIHNVELLKGNAEEIPLPDSCIDVVTSNGVLNLVPDKSKAFAEMYRVLKPGGRFQIADIIINKGANELDEAKDNPRLWAECIVGALHEDTYMNALCDAGFNDVKLHCRQDYFSKSSNLETRKVAEYFNAQSITLSGAKP